MRPLGFLFFLLFLACARPVKIEDTRHLNGYWKINKVTFPDNSTRDYELSSTLDYIEIEEGKGFRKKVQPSLDGTFDTSDDAIPFQVIDRHEDIYLVYSNSSGSWQELLLHVAQDAFAVRNEEGIIYEYARYKPITLQDE